MLDNVEMDAMNSTLVWLISVVVVVAAALLFALRGGAATPGTRDGEVAEAVAQPWWPSNLSVEQRASILSIVEDYFRRSGDAIAIRDGVATRRFNGTQFGLMNLVQVCAQIPQAQWKETIHGHFDGIARSADAQRELEQKAKVWTAIESMLVPRLWRTEDLPSDAPIFVSRIDLEGISTVLAFDLPEISTNVKPEHAAAWDIAHAQVFARALRNLREQHPVDLGTQELEPAVSVTLLAADHFYAASHVLLLDEYPDCIGPYGAVVAVPHSHGVLCHPIHSIDVVRAINRLMPIATGMWKEGPRSISPDLFWYREGRFTRLPYRIEDKKLVFEPPAVFVELLNALAQPD